MRPIKLLLIPSFLILATFSLFTLLKPDTNQSTPVAITEKLNGDSEGDLVMSDGVFIHYWYYERGSNNVTIFLHGGPGHGTSDFRNGGQARRFADNFGDLIVFDQRGAGYSQRDQGIAETINFARYNQDINELREKLTANKPAVILGRSFGGFYATQYANSNPNNVIGYILVSPGSYNFPESERLRSEFEEEHKDEDYIGLRKEAAKLSKKYSDPNATQKSLEERADLEEISITAVDVGSAFENNDHLFEKNDLELLAAHSNVPTLVVYGLLDNMVTTNMIDEMRPYLPNAKFLSLPGSHFAAYEYESEYFSIVKDFYQSIEFLGI